MSTPGSAPRTPVSALGERGLIDRIRDRLPTPAAGVLVGIGDDAAVFEPERGALQILTTDALVEGIHFDRRFSSPADIGYKALAVNASDVAAMGGRPTHALVSLMLPDNLPVCDVDGLIDGLAELARVARVSVIGGNVTRSPGPLVVDVTLAGTVRRRRVLTRSGGRPGQALYVTGALGAGSAGLGWLQAHASDPSDVPDDAELAECVRRYRRPVPRGRVGGILGGTRAAAVCMDLSDGLGDAVRQVAERSGTGARLETARLPVAAGARRWFESRGLDPVVAAVSGGDDYELLFAVDGRRRGRLRTVLQQARGVPVTRIGELTADPGLYLVRPDGGTVDLPRGFAHF
ncbi:MAG TPA: thiamine-phosphate kinase [Vicinamibacterales bacterium]|nr:thiamine-phosphate kinase [Vicinamibacterales bacterium]